MSSFNPQITGYTEVTPGNRSANRLIFLIGSFWNMLLTTFVIIHNHADLVIALAFWSGIQGVLVGQKLGQKAMEGEIENSGIKASDSTTTIDGSTTNTN